MTTSEPTAADNAAVTLVKNQLLHPDGRPQKGVQVDLVVRANNTWTADSTGRVLGQIRTWTGPKGCWRQDLLPWSAYDDDKYVYVEVWENTAFIGAIRVPPMPAGTECWVRKLLVNPPPQAGDGWRPVNQLGDLSNVSTVANRPPPGTSLLMATGAQWDVADSSEVAGTVTLSELGDVGADVGNPGQVLTVTAGREPGERVWRPVALPDPHTPSVLTDLADATALRDATEGQHVSAHVDTQGAITWHPVDPPTIPEPPEVPNRLADLDDVANTQPSQQQLLAFTGTEWAPADPPPDPDTVELGTLADVDTSSAEPGRVLTASTGETPGSVVWRALALPDPHAPSKLTELADATSLATATDGQFVTAHVDTDGVLTWWATDPPETPEPPRLDALPDVDTTGVVNGDVLAYRPDAAGGTWSPDVMPRALHELNDVGQRTPAPGHVLTWDGTTKTWDPAPVPTPEPAPSSSGMAPVGFPALAYGLSAASCTPPEATGQFQVYNTGCAVRMVVPAGVPVTGVTWWVTEAFGLSGRHDCGVAVYTASGASRATSPHGTDTDGNPEAFTTTGAKTSMLTAPIPAAAKPWEAYVVINACYGVIGKIAAQSWPSNEAVHYHASTSGFARIAEYINWQASSSAAWAADVTANASNKTDPVMPYVGLL